MALLTGVTIGISTQMLRNKPVIVDDVFWQSVQEARKAALKHEREVQLKFAVDGREKATAFLVIDGEEQKRFPVPPVSGAGDLTVDFLAAGKGNTILVAGMLLDANPVPYV